MKEQIPLIETSRQERPVATVTCDHCKQTGAVFENQLIKSNGFWRCGNCWNYNKVKLLPSEG